ncbi:MAG: GNAT family N-acetyltransferase [Betaproteobacteria bacterium]
MTSAPDTAELLKTWIQGWAISRACAPPVADGPGWRVEVGAPDQLRRHVFAGDCATLRALGDTVVEPAVWLKACMSIDALRAIVPPRWTVRTEPSYFMRFEGAPPLAGPLPDGYATSLEHADGVLRVRIHAADGALAADVRVVTIGEHAIFDRIGTDEAHRRRGLGRALMAALHATARERGATRGLLAATQAGHALYMTLGWTVQSPYASAVIEEA